ncbi:hypothetical protein Tco_1111474 [Tanacetum coccineum]|uniref:Uncharacterized protein n=1 Tax=Tanacetum coccineum TaxID=301880 RepID=A0ABQ5ILR3_9ASTR
MRNTKDFEAKYKKIKAKLALLSSNASAPNSFSSKNKGLIAKSYDWDEEEVSSDDEETEVKALMALTNKERFFVRKESARNGEWTKITTKKYVNTEILKENQNLRLELKELTSITKTWLNSSNKVNQCINEKIPTQKKKILGIGQLMEDTSSCGSKDLVFVKSSVDNSDMSITSSNLHKSSEAKDSTLNNHDTDEHSSSSTKKLDGVEPGSGLKAFKSILKSKSTFKAETLKGITLNEPSSAPARGNKSSSASKTNSAPAGKLKNVKVEDDPLLTMVMKELNELKLQISKKKYNNHHSNDCLYYPTCEICGTYDHNTHDHNMIISQRKGINPRNPQHVTKNCETCGSNFHTTSDHIDIEWFKKRETPHAKKDESSNALRSKNPTERWASRQN